MKYNFVVECSCDICENNNFELLSKKVQFNMPYKVVICKNCGLVQINPKPEISELNNFYINEYDKYYSTPSNIDNDKFKDRGIKIGDFFKEYLKNDINLLEIGSGGGGNLIGLSEKSNSKNISAIEPNEQNVVSLRSLGINIIGDFYDTKKYDLQDIELVLISHVLEHFYSPKRVLNKLHKETSDSVKVIILVPSIKNYKRYIPLHKYWFRVVHLFYFNLEIMKNLLKITGWKIIKSYDKDGELGLIVEKSNMKNNEILNCYYDMYNEYKNYKSKINYFSLYLKTIINKIKQTIKKF